MANGTQRRVVVTGLGATTPLGGDLPSTWERPARGPVRRQAIEADWVAQYELPVTFAAQLAVPTAETLAAVEARRLDPLGADGAGRRPRGLGATPARPRSEPERLGAVVASGIGGVLDAALRLRRPQGEGRPPGLPADRAHADAQRPGRRVGIELGARAGVHTPVSRLRLRRRGDGLRPRHDPRRAARTSSSPAARRRRSTRCPSRASPRCRRCRRATTTPEAPRALRRGPRRVRPRRGRRARVLETEEHARARGATIYAEVVAPASPPTRTTSPRPTRRAGRDPRHAAGARGGRDRPRGRRPPQRARHLDPGR